MVLKDKVISPVQERRYAYLSAVLSMTLACELYVSLFSRRDRDVAATFCVAI